MSEPSPGVLPAPPSAAGPRFSVLGRALRATGLPAPLERWLRAGWEFPEHALPESRFEILLRPGESPGVGGAEAAPVRLPGLTLPCRAMGERAWELGGAEGGARLELGAGRSRIAFWGPTTGGGAGPMCAALFVALHESLRASGLIPLHASVLARGDAATALLAPSGTGKSCTLLQAVRAGWRPVAEDFAWLELDSLRVYGWDRGVRLHESARARFAADLAGWTAGPDGKLFLPWEALGRTGPRAARLERVALLALDPSRPSAWESLPAREAVRALWEATGVPICGSSRARLERLLPTLLDRVHASRLRLGDTPPAL